MTEEKVRISPGEAAEAGRDRRKSQDKPRGSTQRRGVTEEKVRISPEEVAKPGRDRRKGQDKPQGSRSGGA